MINLISIPGETDQTDEKLETAVVERRSTAETELDLPTESLGKIIDIIETMKHFYINQYRLKAGERSIGLGRV